MVLRTVRYENGTKTVRYTNEYQVIFAYGGFRVGGFVKKTLTLALENFVWGIWGKVRGFRKKLVYFFNLKFCMGDLGSKQWKKPDKLNTGWNGFGKFVGIVWELFGNCLELSDTDYQ